MVVERRKISEAAGSGDDVDLEVDQRPVKTEGTQGSRLFDDDHAIAGADLLIHEVAMAPAELAQLPHVQRLMSHHTVARQAGEVFTRTRPKLAVYTHPVLPGNDQVPPVALADVVAETRRTYETPLEVGEDLMSFDIGERITVNRYGRS